MGGCLCGGLVLASEAGNSDVVADIIKVGVDPEVVFPSGSLQPAGRCRIVGAIDDLVWNGNDMEPRCKGEETGRAVCWRRIGRGVGRGVGASAGRVLVKVFPCSRRVFVKIRSCSWRILVKVLSRARIFVEVGACASRVVDGREILTLVEW